MAGYGTGIADAEMKKGHQIRWPRFARLDGSGQSHLRRLGRLALLQHACDVLVGSKLDPISARREGRTAVMVKNHLVGEIVIAILRFSQLSRSQHLRRSLGRDVVVTLFWALSHALRPDSGSRKSDRDSNEKSIRGNHDASPSGSFSAMGS